MYYRKLLVVFFNLFYLISIAQTEYVPNGGFEEFVNERIVMNKKILYKNIAKDWYYANSIGCQRKVSVVVNRKNIICSNSGYSFISFCSINTGDYTGVSVIQTKLNKALNKDSFYLLKVYLKRSNDCCGYSIKSCKFFFTDSVFYTEDLNHFNLPNILLYKCDSTKIDTSWTLLTSKYKAKGDEKFLTIEINSDTAEAKKVPCHSGVECSGRISVDTYYFLDDVSIKETTDTAKIDCDDKPITKYTKDAVLVLPNINFFTNSDSLTKSSFIELDKLLLELKSNPNLEIEISGHTDDVGNADKNMKLSDLRAKSVKRYFVSKGINEKRMQTKGEGYNKPLVKATDEASRAKNRRVEIKVLKN
ncbi:MAG: OmpA family protein [Bacteroidota bacterium]